MFYDLVEDFNETCAYLEKNYPEFDLYAFGASNGANALLRFLGKYNNEKVGKVRRYRILAAVSVANLKFWNDFFAGTFVLSKLLPATIPFGWVGSGCALLI